MHTRQEPKEPPKPAPAPPRPPPLPTVDGKSGQLDVVSRLLKDRILLLGTDVNDEVANVLVAQLLFLANEDPDKDITLYINSPGGSVSAGLAIYDTMKFIPCDVQTVCFGMAASMGAFLLGAGTPGKRKSLPNARIMIHQPLGGAQGQAQDIEIQVRGWNLYTYICIYIVVMEHRSYDRICGTLTWFTSTHTHKHLQNFAFTCPQAKEILFTKALLNKYIADYTGQPVEKVEADCDRDFFMTPGVSAHSGGGTTSFVRVVFCWGSYSFSHTLCGTRTILSLLPPAGSFGLWHH